VVPSAVTTSFQGTAAAFRTALKGMGWLLALAVVVIYLVLGVLYESFRMIDFAHDAQRREGLAPEAAIRQACLIRFRPIMMTTAAALMAGLPIALGYGGGGDARQPLGLAVVGGLLVSQTLTLYVTPVFFLYMERVRRGVHREPAAG
jgi:HAE1 family hydrophobic/amphiphilic exporter-1